jgi:hypothetical protein
VAGKVRVANTVVDFVDCTGLTAMSTLMSRTSMPNATV